MHVFVQHSTEEAVVCFPVVALPSLCLAMITVKFNCSISQAVTLKAMKVLSFLLGLAYPSDNPSNLLYFYNEREEKKEFESAKSLKAVF